MNSRTSRLLATGSTLAHELRFVSLYDPGRGVAVPCDECGKVDLDSLTESLRNAYFGARALVGREYRYPTVQLVH
ncbi:MAG: hypothetical protein JNL87_13935 [Burkholderiaceae bacterium]|nr:hypothetical protein [Burkholderiaceae bacterium]